jgi:peptidoglycan/LPS O-acetylase OafA/YrhL
MRRLPVLEGWRAAAILLVLIHHVGQGFYSNEESYGLSLTRFGAFGVDIFFGISGLLITRLLLEQRRTSGSFELCQFYVRRAFRILPPCFAFLTGYSLLGLLKSNWELVSSLLFFRNYVPASLTSYGTGHLWSLAVEEHFYLLWPGLLMICGPRRSKNVAGGLALAFGMWRLVESQLPTPLFSGVSAHFRTDLRLDALLWGCVTAFVLDAAKERLKFTNQFRFPMWILAAGVVMFSAVNYSPLTSVFVAVLIPLLLAGTLVHPEWRVSCVLSWTPLVWIGRISYSLYLWQQLFLMPGWEPAAQWWRHWPWNIALTFAAAIASYYLIEKPFIAAGRAIAAKLKKTSIDASFDPAGDLNLQPAAASNETLS